MFTSEKDFTTSPSYNSSHPSEASLFKRPKLPKSVSVAEVDTLRFEGRRNEFDLAADTRLAGKWRGLTSDAREPQKVPTSTSRAGATLFPEQPKTLKRSLGGSIDATNLELPPRKRSSRPFLRPSLDTDTFSSGFHANLKAPVSPLFFSQFNRRRPGYLSTYSEAEAIEIMLKTAREEAGVTTLKLARGNISSPSSSMASGDRRSIERKGTPKSADINNDSAGLKLLGGVGICELLEQDERPTFIFDLANQANLNPGPLQILFGNQALRVHEGLYNMVTGTAHLDSPGSAVVTSDFPEFKAWATSFVKNNEAIDVSLPSFLFCGIRWECKTLRKRIRLISGISSPHLSTLISQSSHDLASNPSLPNSASRTQSQSGAYKIPSAEIEPPDYFGHAVAISSASPPTRMTAEPVEVTRRAVDNVLTEQRPIVDKSLSEIVETLGTAPSLASEAVVALQSAGFRDKTLTGVVSGDFFDWTKLPLSVSLPKHIQFARGINWGAVS